MKKAVIFLLAVPLLLGDVFQELGTNASEGQSYFFYSITQNQMGFPSGARKIAYDQRPRVVKVLGDYFMEYYKSEDFKKRYALWWKDQEPQKPETPEERILREKQEMDNQLKESEKNAIDGEKQLRKQIIDTKDAALKKQLQEVLETMLNVQKQIKEQQNNPEWSKQLKEMQEFQNQAYIEEYKEKSTKYKSEMARWNLIKNPDVLLKEKLEYFLEHSENIDFSAKLTLQNGTKIFIDPELEAKDSFWKLCFRAGKPTLDVARTTAKVWVEQIKI